MPTLTQPMFDCALSFARLLSGFAEITTKTARRTLQHSISATRRGGSSQYRKVHYPATRSTSRATVQISEALFRSWQPGFPVFSAFGGIIGMAICNDALAETYRVLGLKAVESRAGLHPPVPSAVARARPSRAFKTSA